MQTTPKTAPGSDSSEHRLFLGCITLLLASDRNPDEVFILPYMKMQVTVLSFLPVVQSPDSELPFSFHTQMFAMYPCSVISTAL